MGYIKEPDGVDFIINGKPLTEKQKQAISEFIKADKERLANLKNRSAGGKSAVASIGRTPEAGRRKHRWDQLYRQSGIRQLPGCFEENMHGAEKRL